MYTHQKKLEINDKIKKIQNKQIFEEIFNIVKNYIKASMTVNNNGIFFDLNVLPNKILKKLDEYLDEQIECNISSHKTLQYSSYSINDDDLSDNLKLSNKDKNLIKNFKQSP